MKKKLSFSGVLSGAASNKKNMIIYKFNKESDLRKYIDGLNTLRSSNTELIKSVLDHKELLESEKTKYTDKYSEKCLSRALSLFEHNNKNKRKKASSLEKRILSLIKKKKLKDSNIARIKIAERLIKELKDENYKIVKAIKFLRKTYGNGEYLFQSKDAFGRIHSD